MLLLEALFKHDSDQGEESNIVGCHDEWPLNGGDDDEDDGDMEEYGGNSCDWSDSEISLLNHLLVRSAAIYSEGPVSKEEETELNASQHACEIVTTVIQHSLLSSKCHENDDGRKYVESSNQLCWRNNGRKYLN
jgi:hypothetical protein